MAGGGAGRCPGEESFAANASVRVDPSQEVSSHSTSLRPTFQRLRLAAARGVASHHPSAYPKKGARARYFHVGFPQIWALRCFSVICLRVERNIALAFDRIAGKGASAAPNSHGALHTRAPHVSPHPLVLLWRIPPQQQRTTPEALVRRGQVRFR